MLIFRFLKTNYYNLLFSAAIVLGIITGKQELGYSNIQNFLFFFIATFVVYTIAIILLCLENEKFSSTGLDFTSQELQLKTFVKDIIFIPIIAISSTFLYVIAEEKVSNTIILIVLFILIFTFFTYLKKELESKTLKDENIQIFKDIFTFLTVLTLSGASYSVFGISIYTVIIFLILLYFGLILILSNKLKVNGSELISIFFTDVLICIIFYVSQNNLTNRRSTFIISSYFVFLFYISIASFQKYKTKILTRESTLGYISMVLFLTAIVSAN